MTILLGVALFAGASVTTDSLPAFEIHNAQAQAQAPAELDRSAPFAIQGKFELLPSPAAPFLFIGGKAADGCAPPPEGRIFQDGFEAP